VSVSALSLALAFIAAPVRAQHPIQIILSKILAAFVFCFAAVFLLEYACGIRIPDLNVFFLPDSSGQRLTRYAARPTPQSATTSLFFASALLIFRPHSTWRKRAFQISVLAAFVLPTVACFSYLVEFLVPRSQDSVPTGGLSLPAVVLYFTLGSGVFGLSFAWKIPNPAVPGPPKAYSAGAEEWSVSVIVDSLRADARFKIGLSGNTEVDRSQTSEDL
jgi:hypothetical protein